MRYTISWLIAEGSKFLSIFCKNFRSIQLMVLVILWWKKTQTNTILLKTIKGKLIVICTKPLELAIRTLALCHSSMCVKISSAIDHMQSVSIILIWSMFELNISRLRLFLHELPILQLLHDCLYLHIDLKLQAFQMNLKIMVKNVLHAKTTLCRTIMFLCPQKLYLVVVLFCSPRT